MEIYAKQTKIFDTTIYIIRYNYSKNTQLIRKIKIAYLASEIQNKLNSR